MAVRYGDDYVRSESRRRPRRVAAAFGLGVALAIAGLAALAADRAVARGPFVSVDTAYDAGAWAPARAYQPTYSIAPLEAPPARSGESRRRRRRITLVSRASGGERSSRAASGGGQPLCVRLCDGYFFPLPVASGDLAGQTASCNSLCPDAPTEVYYRKGADSLEGAVSATGRPYSSLPVSLRYRNVSDATCACHRDPVVYAPLRDWTLKAGDAVMTPAGFMVFHGAEKSTHAASDFSALGGARLAPRQRLVLEAMERASLRPTHPTLRQWLAQASPAAVARAAPARVARVARADDKIRVLVWRGSQD